VAALLTRGTVAITFLLAVPALVLGPYFVRAVYGSQFADAGVALRFIIPGVIAYSVVAVLTRYLSGQGRPGTTTLILVVGLGINIAANLLLIPRLGINGAALASSVSYSVSAVLTLAVFLRVSGRGLGETLILQRSDLAAADAVATGAWRWLVERKPPTDALVPSEAADELIVTQPEPHAEE
jgi:O-antigen/teichoic acid export membrane protein